MANAALIIGFNHIGSVQMNRALADDLFKRRGMASTVKQTELNQMLLLGDGNSIGQSNANNASDPGYVCYVYQRDINPSFWKQTTATPKMFIARQARAKTEAAMM